MITAKVIRPKFDPNNLVNPEVVLTATVKHGTVTKNLDLKLTVRREGIADSQAVILDLNNISFPSQIKADLVLPIIGTNGSAITWEASVDGKVDHTVIDPSTGKVNRPDYDKADVSVKLTATSKKGTETESKDFTVLVKCWTIIEEADDALALVNWDLVKGTNTNSQAITDNLVFKPTVGRNVTATWSIVSTTSDAAITTGKLDISTGVVSRPTHSQGQVSVTVKCHLVKNTEIRDVTLDSFILSPNPIIPQEILNAAKQDLDNSSILGTNTSLGQIKDSMHLPYKITDDEDAFLAKIEWSLVAYGTHTDVANSTYLVLSDAQDYKLATVQRPPIVGTGNIQIALKATITVGSGTTMLTDTKFFDLTILAV